MLDPSLTTVEILGLGVAQEVEAFKRYQILASMVKNPLVREKFRSLAREEKAHREMLYSLLQRYTGEPKPPLPKRALRPLRPINADQSIPDILMSAIDKEREAQAFYQEAASRSLDAAGRQLLLYLASFEEGHERSLRTEYDALTTYPQWFEFEAADIQLVGP
ncbi:MAG: ferritin-like domain-containing protein [bacterium]